MKYTFEHENGWMVSWPDEIWDFNKNNTNYLAIVTRNANPELKRELNYNWLPCSKQNDTAFCISKANPGDILAGGWKNRYKNRGRQTFMKVIGKTDTTITVVTADSFREAQNA